MPKTYTCEKCARIFQRKSGYTDHMNKKNDCSKTTAIAPILEENKGLKEEVKEMRQATQGPVTKETLPTFFENLHNLLWNRAGLSPERALEHMTFFFAYRMMELQADALHLPDICRWSYVAGLTSADDLYATLDQGTAHFMEHAVTNPFFRQHEIKSAEVVWDIFRAINGIPLTVLQETDTLGDIFEYMLSRGMSTMADEGQYYTNRLICKLAFLLAYRIRKVLRRPDGTLCTFGDWFCGTGGFPAEYIRGVNQNLPDVDWTKDSASIYCQDMNMSSVTTTLLNLLIQTGTPFNGVKRTIRTGNSFQQNITQGTYAMYPGLLLDYSFMNPPYGGDKSKGKAYKFAYTVGKGKDKRFLVNSDIQSIGVEDHDKVSAGVQLAMATLAPEGVCCIVLPQGFFFGATAKAVELRRKLAEEYKIHYVVDIASGAFVNTGTKTSMLVFQKGVGLTHSIQFIQPDESLLAEVTLDQLRQKNYSLNYKQYIAQEVEEVAGFERVRLGELIVADSGDMLPKTSIVHGPYQIIGGGKVVGHHNKTNRGSDEIVISRVGNACLTFMKDEYYLTDNALAIVSKDSDRMLIKYLYYYLTQNVDRLREQYSGTAQPVISKARLLDIQIPLPPLSVQQDIVEAIDGWAQLAHQEEVTLKQLEKQVMSAVKWMGRGQERVRLGEVCAIHHGKRITKKENIGTIYPVYGGGDDTFKTDQKNREGFTCKVSRFGISEHNCVQTVYGDYWLMDSGFTVSGIHTTLCDAYLYYWLLQNKTLVYQCGRATAQMNMDMDTFRDIQIPLPPLSVQQTLQPLFDEVKHKHEKIALYKAMAEQAIKERIPGASSSSSSSPSVPSDPVQESHSSACPVQEDGTGCTCHTAPSPSEDYAPEEPHPAACLPSSTLADAALKKKVRRLRLAPSVKPLMKPDEVAE